MNKLQKAVVDNLTIMMEVVAVKIIGDHHSHTIAAVLVGDLLISMSYQASVEHYVAFTNQLRIQFIIIGEE